jgi:FkbM family methyltransferase
MDARNFRSLLDLTSGPLSLIHPKIRLRLACFFNHDAISTILDPNSINSRRRNRFGDVNKLINFVGDTRLIVNINEMIGYRSALNSSYDQTAFKVAEKLEFRNLHYVDIGANIGTTLIPIAQHGCWCVAFEPNLVVSKRLLANLEMNLYNKVEIILAALGDAPLSGKWLSLRENAGNSGAVSLNITDKQGSHGKLVRVTNLDSALSKDFLESLQATGGKLLIKIDVEGLEGEVIRGGWNTIQTFKPFMLLEQNPGNDFQKVCEELYEIGYKIYSVSQSLNLGAVDPNTRYENVIAIPSWAEWFSSELLKS